MTDSRSRTAIHVAFPTPRTRRTRIQGDECSALRVRQRRIFAGLSASAPILLSLGLPGVLFGQVTVRFDPDTVRVRSAVVEQQGAAGADQQQDQAVRADTVQPARDGRTFLTLRDTGSTPVRDIVIEWLAPPGLSVELEPATPSTLAAREAAGAGIVVRGQSRAAGERIAFRVRYNRADGASDIVIGTLNVIPSPVTSAADAAQVEVVSSLASLTDGGTGTVSLLVSNTTDYPLHIDTVRAGVPEFIDSTGTGGTVVPGRGSRLLTINVKAKDWVRPGKHMLFFDLPMRWTGPEGEAAGNLIFSREVDVGVFGESEILKALGVPSFLLLPGFLLLVAFGMVYKGLGGTTAIASDLKSAEFWAFSILLSLGVAFSAPVLGGRNYLRGYGLRDIAVVWFFAMAAGAIVALGRKVLDNERKRRAAAAEKETAADIARRTPSSADIPQLLMTLHVIGVKGTLVDTVDAEFGGTTVRAWLLADPAADGKIWVAPQITYEWTSRATDSDRTALASALAGDLKTLSEAIGRLRSAQKIVVAWQGSGSFVGPVAVTGFERVATADLVVEA